MLVSSTLPLFFQSLLCPYLNSQAVLKYVTHNLCAYDNSELGTVSLR